MDGPYPRVQSFTSLASDIGFIWNSLAKQIDWRCFIFSRRDTVQNPCFVEVASHVWVFISRILKLFVCMYRIGGQFFVLFVLRHTTFVFGSCW